MKRLYSRVAVSVFLALLLIGSAFVAENYFSDRTMTPDTFWDVDEDDWFYGSVKTAYERGIMEGVYRGIFAPEDTVPWSQAVTITCRVLAADRGEDIPAAKGEWYAPYADYAAKAAILPTDAPQQEEWDTAPIDRQSVAYLFYAAQQQSFPTVNTAAVADIVLVSEEKQEAVEALWRAGIFTGRTDGSFDPAAQLTRAELAAILSRLLCPSYRTQQDTAGLFALAPEGEYLRFTNRVDGYSLLIAGTPMVDMSRSSVAAILESDTLRLEIYKQDISQCYRDNYRTYSNGFLANTADHFTDFQGILRVGERDVFVTAWHRDALARVEQDRNYYVTVDIPVDHFDYTLFLKSTDGNGLMEEALRLAESFRAEESTAPAYTRTAQAVENRDWTQETQAFYQHILVSYSV